MKKILQIGCMLLVACQSSLHAQVSLLSRINQFADLSGTAGDRQGTTSVAYIYDWRLGLKKRWEIGVGARWTSYFGTKRDFTTAPGRLARSTTIPFVIVFAGQETQNWDTLTVQRPSVNSINLSANFGYAINTKWSAGFNIDLIGFSFGRKGSGILTSNGLTRNEPNTKPTAFNVLLTGDNDYGNLASEFFLKYQLDKRWGIRAIYELYFAEYKTSTVKQTAPDGTIVDRFRNKSNTAGLGLAYHF